MNGGRHSGTELVHEWALENSAKSRVLLVGAGRFERPPPAPKAVRVITPNRPIFNCFALLQNDYTNFTSLAKSARLGSRCVNLLKVLSAR